MSIRGSALDAATGRYKFTSGGNVLTGANATQGESGQPWRGFDPSAKNRHWANPSFLAEQMPPEFARLGVLANSKRLRRRPHRNPMRRGLADSRPLSARRGRSPVRRHLGLSALHRRVVHGTNDGIDADVAWLGPTDPERLG